MKLLENNHQTKEKNAQIKNSRNRDRTRKMTHPKACRYEARTKFAFPLGKSLGSCFIC